MRELMKPGMSFPDFAHAAPKLPAGYVNERLRLDVPPGRARGRGAGIPYPDKAKKGIPEREIRET